MSVVLVSPLDSSSTRVAAPTLLRIRVALGIVIAGAFPVATALVFGAHADRQLVADALSYLVAFGFVALFGTAFWPLSELREWPLARRLESASMLYLGVSYFTHLTWELGWLVLHRSIAASRDSMWAYSWWAYIDGGDMRYAHAAPELLAIEILSVANGLAGVYALVRHRRAGGHDRTAIHLLFGTAVVHLYSASFYYLSELVAGCPNVDTTRFVNLWIKFGLANLPWVVMPWVVFAWARGALARVPTEEPAAPRRSAA